MSLSPIQQAHTQYKQWTRDAMREAAVSVVTVMGLAACSTAAGLGTLWLMTRKNPNPAMVTGGGLVTVLATGVAIAKGLDARADFIHWATFNDGKRRAEFSTGILQAQTDGLVQLSNLWVSSAQAANAWHMQQLYGHVPAHKQPMAIDVAAEPAALPPALPQPIDIAHALAVRLKSSLIVGQPGSGKGLTVAHATRHLKVLQPDLTIWVIDPKADPDELAYWNACDRVMDVGLPSFPTPRDVERFQDEVESFIECFKLVQGPKLLIFDEALAVKESCPKWMKGIMAGFNHMCSTGRSKRAYGWLISQTPNADDFGISGGARNVYRRVLLMAAEDQGLIANRSTFFSGTPDDATLAATGRVFFDSLGGQWGAVPQYPLINEPAIQRDAHGRWGSRHEQLERMWEAEAVRPEPAFCPLPDSLSDVARCVAKFMRRNGPIVEVEKMKHTLSAEHYGFSSQDCDTALTQLKSAGVIDFRNKLAALKPQYRGG